MNKATFDQEHSQLLEEKHQTTVKNISELQEMEKYMYQNLEKLNTGGNATQVEQEQILNRINELTQMRINLFNQLKNTYTSSTEELNDSRHALADQITLVGVIEEELNKTKANYKNLLNDKNNKLRMVEIGTYQAQRYSAHVGVMKIVATCSLIVLIFSVLYKKDLLPSSITTGGIITTAAVGLILIIRKVIDLSRRSNFVYDQYTWPTNQAALQPGYQTVIQHDEKFFGKVGSEAQSGISSVYSDTTTALSKAKSLATSAGSSITSMADNVTTTAAPKKQTLVSPSPPAGIENFANYY